MNGGENMPRNRFAVRLAVSAAVTVAVCVLPLVHCSTNTSAATGKAPAGARVLAEGFPCVPSTNPFAPVVCISAGGIADPDNVVVHSHADGLVPNRIVFLNATGSGRLSIRMGAGCTSLDARSLTCTAGTCSVLTIPQAAKQCDYTASIDGVMGSDPIIVTDNCCPTTTGEEGKKR